jgi:hypothetical protein
VTFPYGETVTVRTVTVTGSDALGNDTFSTTDVAHNNIPVWDPRFSTEQVQGQDLVTSDYALWFPSRTVVLATDRVIVRGDVCEVDGKPSVFVNPFTGTSGVQVNLRMVTG